MDDTIRAFNTYLNGYIAGYRDAALEYGSLHPIEKPLLEAGFSQDEVDELLLTLEGEEGALFIPRSKELLYKFMAFSLDLEEEYYSPMEIVTMMSEKGFDVSIEDAQEIIKQKKLLDL